jgi:hypothetical protein
VTRATDYVKIQVVGTPGDCLQQIAELQRLTGLTHLVGEFGFGGMPREEAATRLGSTCVDRDVDSESEHWARRAPETASGV